MSSLNKYDTKTLHAKLLQKAKDLKIDLITSYNYDEIYSAVEVEENDRELRDIKDRENKNEQCERGSVSQSETKQRTKRRSKFKP